MSFTAQDVMSLRQKTGLGMMDCKNALAEKDGDPEAAEQWLRETKKGKMDARTERTTGEGRIEISFAGGSASIIEVRTETDFTARNESFLEAVEKIAAMALEGADGEVELTDEVTAIIDDLRITTGENTNFGRGFKYSGGTFGHYIHHDGKRACLLQLDGETDDELAKGIAVIRDLDTGDQREVAFASLADALGPYRGLGAAQAGLGVGVEDREVELVLGRAEIDEEIVDLVEDFRHASVAAVDLVDHEDRHEL